MTTPPLLKFAKGLLGGDRTIPLNRSLLEFLEGDHLAAILLAQIVYWSERTEDAGGWFYKTHKDWFEETMISKYQVNRIVDQLATERVIETKLNRVNGAPVLHFRLFEFEQWIVKKLDNRKSKNLTIESEEISLSYKEHRLHTETTDREETLSSLNSENLKSKPVCKQEVQTEQETPTPPEPPPSPFGDDVDAVKVLTYRFKAMKGGKMPADAKRVLTEKVDSCGKSPGEIVDAFEFFMSLDFWKDFNPLHRVRAFFKWLADEDGGIAPRKAPRAAINQGSDQFAYRAPAVGGLKSTVNVNTIPPEAELWNRLVPHGMPITTWSRMLDPQRQLDSYRTIDHFAADWTAVCGRVEKILQKRPDVDWLTFDWLMRDSAKGVGWNRVLKGKLDFLVKPNQGFGAGEKSDEEKLAEIRKEMGME